MAANYGDDDTVGVYGGDIEAQLEQMRINTIESLRKIYAVDGGDVPAQDEAGTQTQTATPPQQPSLYDAVSGQPVSVFIGESGRGLTNDAARLLAGRQNRINADDSLTYTAEEHGDPSLPNKWAMVGRRVAEPDDRDTASNDAKDLGIVATALRQNLALPNAVSAFGNALADSDSQSERPTQEDRASDSYDPVSAYGYRNGSDIQSDIFDNRALQALARSNAAARNSDPYYGNEGRGSVAPVQSDVSTDVNQGRNGIAGVDEGDPTPLRLRSAAEFRDLARSAWNGLVGVAEFGLMVGKGALRLYDRNPDGSPNLNSITSPILDDWRLNYESEPYRNGLGLVGEMLSGTLAPAGFARLGRIRSFGLAATSEGQILSGAAAKTHATEALWVKNTDGARSLEQAVNLADEAGSFGKSGMVDYTVVAPNQVIVDLGDGVRVKYVAVDDSEFVKNVKDGGEKFAAYQTNEFDPKMAKNGARFTDVFNDGIALVQVRKSVLESDRALVAVLGHEAFELSGLGVRLRTVGAKFNEIQTYVGQLHVGAVDFADGLVRQMMGKK